MTNTQPECMQRSDATALADSAARANAKPDDFYVGYMPTPRSHRSTLRVVVPAFLLGLAGVASIMAFVQRDPGSGTWSADAEQFAGVVVSEPVPMLIVSETEGQRALLLVEEGKHGARERVVAFDGKQVQIRGTRLSREGRTVVEIVGGERGVKAASGESGEKNEIAMTPTMQRVTLRGEIIDSKCYHGAMKPGDGKTHKACATLCVRNGIPPMFAAEDERGQTRYFLFKVRGLVTPDDDTLSKIGELTEVTGDVSRIADIDVLTIDAGSVNRVN